LRSHRGQESPKRRQDGILPPEQPSPSPQLKIYASDIHRKAGSLVCYRPDPRICGPLADVVAALSRDFPLADIMKALTWQEYEELLPQLLEKAGFHAQRTFRFSSEANRFEIDCIAQKGRNILVIDAKRWTSATPSPSAVESAIRRQDQRIQALKADGPAFKNLLQQLQCENQPNSFHVYNIILVSSELPQIIFALEGTAFSFSHFNDFIAHFQEYRTGISFCEISATHTRAQLG
jgi:Holliday junction resolvase-like predicted endonuclease